MEVLIRLNTFASEKPLSVNTTSDDPLVSEIIDAVCEILPQPLLKFTFRKYAPFLAIAERKLKLDPSKKISHYKLKNDEILTLMSSGVDPDSQ